MFFYLRKILFWRFLEFEGDFALRKHDLKYRDIASLTVDLEESVGIYLRRFRVSRFRDPKYYFSRFKFEQNKKNGIADSSLRFEGYIPEISSSVCDVGVELQYENKMKAKMKMKIAAKTINLVFMIHNT